MIILFCHAALKVILILKKIIITRQTTSQTRMSSTDQEKQIKIQKSKGELQVLYRREKRVRNIERVENLIRWWDLESTYTWRIMKLLLLTCSIQVL